MIRDPHDKIMTIEQAVVWRRTLKRRRRRLVVTNGCFDILHRGHVSYLCQARAVGEALLVAVNSDASVRALKGPERPVNKEFDRAYLLAGLESVDAVVIFDSLRADPVLETVRPDVYVKGGDISIQTLPPEEREVLERCGARIKFLPFVEGFSTTGTIHRVRGTRHA